MPSNHATFPDTESTDNILCSFIATSLIYVRILPYDVSAYAHKSANISAGQQPIIDANGDGVGWYNIYQYNSTLNDYKNVGEWSAGVLRLDVEQVRAGLVTTGNGTDELPLSVCSTDCPRGKYRAYQDQQCCWTCIPCDTTISIIPNLTSCIECEYGFLPNVHLNACLPMIPETIEWSSSWALAPSAFSAFGIFCTGVVIYVFWRYNKTPIIMASGRELCYFMIAGILCCYAMTFVLVNPPNVITCAVARVGLGLFMSAIYAAILTKTSRLARVFSDDIKSAQRPRFITPKAQVLKKLCN